MKFNPKLALLFITPSLVLAMTSSIVKALPIGECLNLKSECRGDGGTVTQCNDIYLKCRSTPDRK